VQTLRGDHMRVALSLWLGMPIPELAHEQDPLGRARCRLDHSGQNARHRGLVDAVGDLLIEAGFRVWTEVVGLYGRFPESMSAAARGRVVNDEGRRMDLVAVSVELEALCVDPTLIDPAAPSQRARLSPLDAAEAHKAEHYADTPAPYKFYPCAVGTQTELASRQRSSWPWSRCGAPRGATSGRSRAPRCLGRRSVTCARRWAELSWRTWPGRFAPAS
jgi:hypothetical protein